MILILVGNIGVGKSTIGKLLGKEYGLVYVDIVDLEYKPEEQMRLKMYSEVMTNFLNGKGSIVEFTGSEPWMVRLIGWLKKFEIPSFCFEVYLESLSEEFRRIQKRNRPSVIAELDFAGENHKKTFIPDAIRIENTNLEAAFAQVKKEIQKLWK